MITQQELKKLLHYEPASGIFTWRVARTQRINVGDIAGWVEKDGYCRISINGKNYRAHRLSWLDEFYLELKSDAIHQWNMRVKPK